MRRILPERIVHHLRWVVVCLLFSIFYIYFFLFNQFHLAYLEQTQLFRFSRDYFQSYLEKPGELIFYCGEFLTQFFVNPYFGAGIVTLLAAIVSYLSCLIFKKLRANGMVWSIFPVLLMAALQSDHQFKIGLSVGLILSLLFAYSYLQLSGNVQRFIIGGIGWPLLYCLSGGFALFASVLLVLFELFYFKSKTKWIPLLGIFLVSIGFPYLGWKFFYLIIFRDAWFFPFPFWGASRIPLFAALLGYFPLMVLFVSAVKKVGRKDELAIPWNYATVSAGSIVIIGGFVLVKTNVYDSKAELLLGMDHYVQEQDWNKVIGLSKTYPGANQMILYYTNLALYKTGQMSDRMFDFKQHGISGLRLEWKRNEVTPFFGGEIFYHLNYMNEAYRWAFELMEAKGLNPRSLKRLVLTSLVNRQYELAAKYLNKLDESIFYKEWANRYRPYFSDTAQISQNRELAEKRRFLVKHDFISDAHDYNLGLTQLLREHPQNRMAFEYLMAAFLLNKDIAGFAANIYRLKEMGYREIPVSYEEALLFCMVYFKKDLVPEGFSIRPSTIQRKNDYVAQLSGFGRDRKLAARELYKQFGKTYWYYLHFAEQSEK